MHFAHDISPYATLHTLMSTILYTTLLWESSILHNIRECCCVVADMRSNEVVPANYLLEGLKEMAFILGSWTRTRDVSSCIYLQISLSIFLSTFLSLSHTHTHSACTLTSYTYQPINFMPKFSTSLTNHLSNCAIVGVLMECLSWYHLCVINTVFVQVLHRHQSQIPVDINHGQLIEQLSRTVSKLEVGNAYTSLMSMYSSYYIVCM